MPEDKPGHFHDSISCHEIRDNEGVSFSKDITDITFLIIDGETVILIVRSRGIAGQDSEATNSLNIISEEKLANLLEIVRYEIVVYH